ncbi:MFS transporter [Acuticoccus sp. I52.16.1]|uniref:MFS transporter n=1 Tax=Acuticoccus sp. I52.16.1 TaxID=2928472 RepID=UPI001FD21305|nr:MFS transporter [Acuticoccus sp. I52.16.1]UOM34626.1 MFS transporter [Acuticoccus sp. I52.16.1]
MSATSTRSVQSYLDERPAWPDATPAPGSPVTPMQWRIFFLASAGKFFEGMVVFMGGIALPLIAEEFAITKLQHGLVTAASLFGILVGASLLGGLADRHGRKRLFVLEMVLFTVFLVLVCVSPGFWWLLACLFGIGLALGCDYPTAHLVISETTASEARGRMVLGAFAFQAVGAMFGTGVSYLVLANVPDIGAWRYMYAVAVVPAVLVILARLTIPESPHFLMVRGRMEEAREATRRLLQREPMYPSTIELAPLRDDVAAAADKGYGALFNRRNRRATILASVPWFLQDLGTYGIGIFTPVILANAVGSAQQHASSVATLVERDMLAAKGAALIDVLLLVGILAAIVLADRVGRIRLQVIGFVGCAAGLAIAAAAATVEGPAQTVMIFAGFMLFNFMTNMGPNAQTYLIAGEVFPTEIRAKGAGFAASFAKIGAVATAFLFPVLLVDIGTEWLLGGLVATSLVGAVVTAVWRIETSGLSLEAIGAETEAGAADLRPDRVGPSVAAAE